MFQIKTPGRKNDGTLHPSVIYSIQKNSGIPFSFFFFLKILFIFHETYRDSRRDRGSGRSRVHAGSSMRDSNLGLQDYLR